MNSYLWRRITLLGSLNILIMGIFVLLSYGLGPRAAIDRNPIWVEFQSWILTNYSLIPHYLKAFSTPDSPFSQSWVWLIIYITPILISSFVFIIVLILLARNNEKLDSSIPKVLFNFSAIFAILLIFAIPVLVMDFWYPLAWGRMILQGINPYYTPLFSVPEITSGLPMEGSPEKMMYGPLWAVLSAGVMSITGKTVIISGLVFKTLLAAFWIGSLRVIWLLLRASSIWTQSVGVLIFGWLPIGVTQVVAEGHNDIVMAFFIVLWLHYLEKRLDFRARLALMGSVVVKYVSAPLFILDFLYWYRNKRISFKYYLFIIFSITATAIVLIGLFYRSPAFFSYLPEVSQWHFFSIPDALRTSQSLIGINLPGNTTVVRIFFIVVFGWYLRNWWLNPTPQKLWGAALALMVLVLFGVNRHFWPWYIIWVLGLVALAPGTNLGRWLVGIALLCPFPMLIWIIFPNSSDFLKFDLPALGFYLASMVWYFLVPRNWFPPHLLKQSA